LSKRLWKVLCAAGLGLSCASSEGARQGEGEGSLAPLASGGEDIPVALSALSDVDVVATHNDGVPFFIQGSLGWVAEPAPGLVATEELAGMQEALHGIAPVFRLRAEDLVYRRRTVDALGHRHLRFAQTRNGRPVIGGELVLHVDDDGSIYSANSSARDTPNPRGLAPPVEAQLSVEAAEVAARRGTSGVGIEARGTGREVYVRSSKGALVLAHEVHVTGRRDALPVDALVYVNASSGELELVDSRIHTGMDRRVHSANNGTSTPGALSRSEGQTAVGKAHVDTNYDHLGTTFRCYRELFGRDSYDNAGATLISTVHYSAGYVNAYWDGNQMVYGDGDGTQSGPLGMDLDITVHELTHAVTSSESDLIYANESGALNEAFSDIFAAACESWSRGWATDADVWRIAEDIWTPGAAGDALRYMDNPTRDGWSRDYYPERYTGTADSGGVHWNSGIVNLAFKLLAVGGTHPREKTTVVVPGIGVEKAARIFYKANTDIFTPSTHFVEAKTGTEQAARQLGYDAATVDAVRMAWEAVGVGVIPPPPPITVLSNGVPVSSLTLSGGGKKYFKLTVPPGQPGVKFTTRGGSGDLDMYVKSRAVPSTTTYDCRPYKTGNTEECLIADPVDGDWYVMLSAYATYSGVTLMGSYEGLAPGTATEPYPGAVAEWRCWTLAVPPGKDSVTFEQAGGSGDADLYVRFGQPPTLSSYSCRPYLSDNTETCTVRAPVAGTWYACSHAYTEHTGTTMKGSY
jgi:bacillolysin